MGIDWGIALGSAAKTGLDTFTKLKEQERLEALEARQAEQFDAWRKEQALRAEELDAAKTTFGKVGTENYSQAIQEQGGAGSQQAQMLSNQVAGMGAENEEASARSATNAMRQNAGKEQITSALPSQTYTREQAAEDYKKRMYGINPEKAMQSELTQAQLEAAGLSIKQSKRIEKQQVGIDKFYENQTAEKIEFNKDKKEWFTKNIGAYNNATKGPLNDGLTAELVEGMGGTYTVVRKDSKGKIHDANVFNDQLADLAFKEIQKAKFFELPGNMQAAIANDLEKRKVGATETTAAAATKNAETQAGFYGPGGVYQQVANQKVAAGGGGVNSPANQEKIINSKAEMLMKGQPTRFKDIDQAKAWVVNTQLKGFDVDKNWADAEKELIKQGNDSNSISRQKDAFYSRQGFAPASIMAIASSGINPETKKPWSEIEKQQFYRKYPNSEIEFGTPELKVEPPKQAIPVVKPVEKKAAATGETAIPGYNAPGYSAKGAALKNIEALQAKLDTAVSPTQKRNISVQLAKEQNDFNTKYK